MQLGNTNLNKPFGTNTVLSKIMPSFNKVNSGQIPKPLARHIHENLASNNALGSYYRNMNINYLNQFSKKA